MLRSLYGRGVHTPVSSLSAALGSRSPQLQYRMAKPGLRTLAAQLRCGGAPRGMHHRVPQAPRLDPNFVRRMVVWPFIGVNVVVFFWWQMALAKQREARVDKNRGGGDDHLGAINSIIHSNKKGDGKSKDEFQHMLDNYTLSWRNLQEGRWRTLFTSALSHSALDHLLFNMISWHALASFGVLGAGLSARAVLGLGAGAALAGDFASLYHWGQPSGQPSNDRAGLGASGAISGLATALACKHPRAPFQFAFIPIPIPLWGLVVGYLVYDSFRMGAKDNIGHAAHVGGSLSGVLMYALFLRRPRIPYR